MRRSRILASLALIPALLQAGSGASLGDSSFGAITSFNGTNGSAPAAGVTFDAQGNIYGTTFEGGANNDGAVYKIAAGTTTVTTIASFNQTNGKFPESNLVADAQGNLYGTTYSGGSGNDGTVFKIAAGTSVITTIATFTGTANGTGPESPLIIDAQGNIYGTTGSGGSAGEGTVFKINTATSTLTTLTNFTGTNGAYPGASGVVMDAAGNLYGTTVAGGANNDGTVFKIAAGTNTLSTLVSFNGAGNGAFPENGVTLDSKGNLYGVAQQGGSANDGTIFKIAAGTSTLTTLATFTGANGVKNPNSGLLVDLQGNLFGTTAFGGSGGYGTLFELASGSSSPTTLVSFNMASGDAPTGNLAFDGTGNIYGTSQSGGANGYGTVYEVINTNAVVPEPASLLALGQALALGGIALASRARSRQQRAS